MKTKRTILMTILVVVIAALAFPLIGLRARASVSSSVARAASRMQNPGETHTPPGETQGPGKTNAATPANPGETSSPPSSVAEPSQAGKISPDVLKALGIVRARNPKAAADKLRNLLLSKKAGRSTGDFSIQSGQPTVLDARSALSAALMTTIGGRDNQFSEVTLIADWDGREDCTADREQKLDDFSFVENEIDMSLLRTAISEHTVANGFNENVYYYGDSVGNLWVGTDTNPGVNTSANGAIDLLNQINIPALVNTGSSGGFNITPGSLGCTDDQVAVTGIAVEPVADLSDFPGVICGTIGEVVYVSILDTEGCSSNAANQPIRTRIFAFAFVDGFGAGASTPASATAVRQVFSAPLSNVAGVTLDDDGSLYFHLVDLIGLTGGAIFKATPIPHVPFVSCALRSTRVVPAIPTVGLTSVTPLSSSSVRLTNYSSRTTASSGVGLLTPTFGNIVAIETGPCNTVFAAVARSFVPGAVSFEQLTEGLFQAPAAFPQGLPSMVISFADCSGAFDVCSGVATGGVTTNIGGVIPVGDGIADVQPATPGASTTRIPGVNNFRLFVQGDGPDVTGRVAGNAIINGATVANTIAPIIGFQVDFSLHSGIVVNEEGTVFVISGGTPAGIGKNPSPMLGEILCFEDMCPMDRRADFVDLRGNGVPNPPASGGNVGDGDSDRFDHIFYQAPLDQVTLTPGGLAGLATGFLRYPWRLAPNPMGPGVQLGVTKTTLGDDDSSCLEEDGKGGPPRVPSGGGGGPIIFEFLDPGHQVAGGDDQNPPFFGDDDNGAGTPSPIPPVPNSSAPGTLRNGGFEFLFGGPVGTAGCVWNGFCWNSNGNITFGAGDTDFSPTVPEFRTGPPRIAPAWTDLDPAARDADLRDFPVLALGFANINDFRIRWINVPEFGNELCTGDGGGFSNTFSINLFDDGTGFDENANQALNPVNPIGNNSVPFDLLEGPTDLRFTTEPTTGVIIGCPPRPEGSGIFTFEYCRMDLLGGNGDSEGPPPHPVLVGFSIGNLNPLIPPGLCEINISTAAATADTKPFGVVQGTTASFCNCCIGEGTEPTLFEFFNEGSGASVGPIGQITFATPDFDLRFEGNDAALCTPIRQRDVNRGKVCFLGVGCAPPANPICVTVTPVGTVPVAAGQPAVGSSAAGSRKDANGNRIATPTSGIINAVCQVQLNILGCGFFPNEVTTICQGFGEETGVPLQRPGKVVSTAVTLTCDFNGDGIPEAVIALVNVTPINCNLVRATVAPPSTSIPGGLLNCSGFPASCCGGLAALTVTTTFTAGDNNVFGPFTRTATCVIDLGIRAPVVFSVTPSSGPCGICEDVLISGACFCLPDGTPNVTSVFAVSGSTTIQASGFKILNCNLIDAEFCFTSANAGKTFFVFLSGPNGQSRNIGASQAVSSGPAAGCPASSNGGLGNEQCFQVTFTCNAPGQPTDTNVPIIAEVTSCSLERDDTGAFTLQLIGKKFKDGADVKIGGKSPKKAPKFKDLEAGTTNFTRISIKKPCSLIPGVVIVTNPNQPASAGFTCSASCPTS